MTVQAWTFAFVGLSFGLYLYLAWRSRVRDIQGFYVAGRGVPAIANGMATAADWMSAASFLGMAGLISFLGYAGGVYLIGWTGGFVLLALLLAPYLRKFGHYTVPDFVGDRYESSAARLTALLCALVRRLLFTGEHALVAQYVVRLGEQADEDATEEYKAYLSLLQQALLAAQFEAAVVGRWSKAQWEQCASWAEHAQDRGLKVNLNLW